MSKRPPEMVELTVDRVVPWGFLAPGETVGPDVDVFETVDAIPALAAIRSLRVKLFRERAKVWRMRASSTFSDYSCLGENIALEYSQRDDDKAARFFRIADAIERGER